MHDPYLFSYFSRSNSSLHRPIKAYFIDTSLLMRQKLIHSSLIYFVTQSFIYNLIKINYTSLLFLQTSLRTRILLNKYNTVYILIQKILFYWYTTPLDRRSIFSQMAPSQEKPSPWVHPFRKSNSKTTAINPFTSDLFIKDTLSKLWLVGWAEDAIYLVLP